MQFIPWLVLVPGRPRQVQPDPDRYVRMELLTLQIRFAFAHCLLFWFTHVSWTFNSFLVAVLFPLSKLMSYSQLTCH
jgi:hypothetical protein